MNAPEKLKQYDRDAHAVGNIVHLEHFNVCIPDQRLATLFYVVGGLLAVFAVLISVLGISRIGTFPNSKGQTRGVIGLAALLVLAAMASAIGGHGVRSDGAGDWARVRSAGLP